MRCLAFAALLLAAASAAGAEPTPLLSIALNADIRSIELARFPGYQSLPGARDGAAGGKQALAEKLRFVVFPDRSVMNAALLSGQVDIVPDVGATEIDAMKAAGAQVAVTPTLSWAVLLLQTATRCCPTSGYARRWPSTRASGACGRSRSPHAPELPRITLRRVKADWMRDTPGMRDSCSLWMRS